MTVLAMALARSRLDRASLSFLLITTISLSRKAWSASDLHIVSTSLKGKWAEVVRG